MILLMSGILGINPSLFEAAEIDGANSTQTFFRITVPLLQPIFVFVVVTSMIGGLRCLIFHGYLTWNNHDLMHHCNIHF